MAVGTDLQNLLFNMAKQNENSRQNSIDSAGDAIHNKRMLDLKKEQINYSKAPKSKYSFFNVGSGVIVTDNSTGEKINFIKAPAKETKHKEDTNTLDTEYMKEIDKKYYEKKEQKNKKPKTFKNIQTKYVGESSLIDLSKFNKNLPDPLITID